MAYRWLLEHVRDGLGRAYPRPFVRLVEEAARIELQHMSSVASPRLLDPASLRRALDRVSADHVAQARDDEWPWLEAVKTSWERQAVVPWERDTEVVRLLESFPVPDATKTPPFTGRDLLSYLFELGILRRRPDGRVDASDLYLAGLGLRRKGGVNRSR